MTLGATGSRIETLDFALEYDGEALSSHEIDVRQLAPALLNAAELFQAVNRLVNPTDPDVHVNIRATREGSVLLELKLLYEGYVAAGTSPFVVATDGLLALFGGVAGLIHILKKIGQSGEPESEVTEPNGITTFIWADNVTLSIETPYRPALDSPSVRNPLWGVVQPLQQTGIDVFKLELDGETVSAVESEDLDSFRPDAGAPEREILTESDRETYLTIRSTPFDTGLRWRFTEGDFSMSAFVTDREFNQRIEDRLETFAKGDVLHCRLHTTNWRDSRGIHADFRVIEVIEKVPPASPNIPMQ